jgi:anti-sigma regulatory factor (Ser/Thr protein kinase)
MDKNPESKKFIATLDSLTPIREFLINIGESVGLDKKKSYKLCLAVDEIATNIINYGYTKAGIENGEIEIITFTDKKRLNVILEDKAIPFNPLIFMTPSQEDLSVPLEERPIGGLGIMLARDSVDEFNYNYTDGKNRNILCINLK